MLNHVCLVRCSFCSRSVPYRYLPQTPTTRSHNLLGSGLKLRDSSPLRFVFHYVKTDNFILMKSPTTICPSTTSTSTSTAPINDLEPNMDQPSSRPSDGAASTDDQSLAADLNRRHAGDQPLQSPKHSAPAYVKQRHLIWHNRVFYPESISRQGQLAVASDLAAARDRVQQQTVLLAVAQRQLSELEKLAVYGSAWLSAVDRR